MEVTVLGMVMFVRREKPENAESPIKVTPLGIVILLRLEQLENAG